MGTDEASGKIDFVTRGQAAVVVAILVALLIFTNIRLSLDEQEIRSQSKQYQSLQSGVDRLDNDMNVLIKEIVQAKKEQP